MTTKLRLDIPVLLPNVHDGNDACVRRLIDEISAKAGVVNVHVRPTEGQGASQLCIHYDTEQLSFGRIREIVDAAGAKITERYAHVIWKISGINHQRRSRTVENHLRALPGVLAADIGAGSSVHVDFDRQQCDVSRLAATLRGLGVQILDNVEHGASTLSPAEHAHDHQHTHDKDSGAHKHSHAHGQSHADHGGKDEAHSHEHGGMFGANTELIFSLLCGALLGTGWLIEKFVAGMPAWLPMACFVAAYFFGGFYTIREAIDNIRLKRFEIDTLMLVAAAGAAALGSWAEGALLLFLFSLGHALEHYAMGRAKRAIEALAKLAPEVASVRRDGKVVEIKVEELRLGDVVIVRPNERLPADGFIVLGNSAINQAPVTGESIPVDKRPVDDVSIARARPDGVDSESKAFAGAINGSGAIEIEVTRRSTESALARVVKMVSEAETRKSATQRFTDKFERIFVPAVLALAFLLLFAWVIVDEPFRDSFYRAMAVLVAASPCALAIATPSAVLSGIARAARSGVLIKGGAPLEELGSLNAIAFDKTGTLTEGRPRITDVVPAEGVSVEELLNVALAVEAHSDHPLAAAITRDAKKHLGSSENPPLAQDIKSLTGRGVIAAIAGETVWIGKLEMFGSDGVPPLDAGTKAAVEQLREKGRTTMVVRHGQRDLGTIGLMDTPRAGAREALQELRGIGITRMIMISGDHQKVADAVAGEVGLDEAWGNLMPEDKVDAIRKLRQSTKVAMVGDGVNDAPAMANSTVGIAMGAAGSDVALETADVALMADDLKNLPFAVDLSRHTRSVIRQNVFISLGVVAFLVPATIFGLSIGVAVAMHEGSTLIVVFNALRLLAYSKPNSNQQRTE
ncbi:heavy metal translocating P-type ATPase [Herbaspirillum sp. C7C2]|uniref:heavy metal translocating P-type ATPase n=1 Tax=Herbaspirillum TaxID=963 RepID=UPI001F5169BB|nr:heavy metal translocating P-type ATPase [Herbaspirillum sp. C7C2]MCI1016737.1 heavy metal translocating P-type ATPase [Herbaspirillum sp. C7C2]